MKRKTLRNGQKNGQEGWTVGNVHAVQLIFHF
jgi:hypothetical protein